ncbi:2Fe-2S iron-sulfur cluster-binding protein [Adhaeretor mobilis]|uniref:Flavohemoprotein n=1 Tax=Adhaeretor mobilis TaxID=1930276 RepID=A0A517N0K3_9BACT|nr:2Fe-2S iron-sulfur cluster-binding protein [Adhaeretor mobilis]QDT00634.1 Flavohemoprotein [Adhaeretor mobilis]
MLDAPALGLLSGAALLGAAGVRAGLAARTEKQRQRRKTQKHSNEQQQFNSQLAAALEWARASQPALKAWHGTRQFTVTAVIDEAAHCRSYYLEPTDGKPLPRYAPGQYLTFHLPTPDTAAPLVRCYSLSDHWREDRYRVTIKHALPPADQPGIAPGLGSSFFHQHVVVGSNVYSEAPQGSFFFDAADSLPVVFIAGGIGVTPMMSMIAALASRNDQRQAWLFQGFRNRNEHTFHRELTKHSQRLPRLQIRTAYSQPQDPSHSGYDHHGYIDINYLQRELQTNNYRFYVCGPPTMMQSLVPALWAWGVPREHVHFEAFGPATIRGIDMPECDPCDVFFSRAEKTVRWDGEHDTLLAAATAAGVEVSTGCLAGNCGQCRLNVVAGRVAHLKQPGVELTDGECLACIAVPEGDVVLE